MSERKVIMVAGTDLWWRQGDMPLDDDVGLIHDTAGCKYEMVPLFFPEPEKGDVLVVESRPNDQMSSGVSWRVVEEEVGNDK